MSIHADPVIIKLLEKVPTDMRGSFSADQLLALKMAVGGRAWGAHGVDMRWTWKIWRWQYYFVFLAGRNRRELSKRAQRLRLFTTAAILSIFLAFSSVMGILVLYLAKSALGIDLIPGFSFGIWNWFEKTFFH